MVTRCKLENKLLIVESEANTLSQRSPGAGIEKPQDLNHYTHIEF